MVVYADVLFLLNFSIDYLILHAVSRGLHKGKKLWFCALLGGFYGVGVIQIPSLGTPFFQILFGVFLILIAYRPTSVTQFCKAFFLFWTVSFLLGGLLYGILISTRQGHFVNGVLYFDFSLLEFSFFTMIGWCIITVGSRIMTRVHGNGLRIVEISNHGKSIHLSAFVDTGCELKEPFTGFPVMVVEYDKISQLLSEEFQGMLNMKNTGPVPEKIYQVPFSTVKKGHGLMLAFRPDFVRVRQKNGDVTLNRVLVGIVDKKLSGDQSYSALLPPTMTI